MFKIVLLYFFKFRCIFGVLFQVKILMILRNNIEDGFIVSGVLSFASFRFISEK